MNAPSVLRAALAKVLASGTVKDDFFNLDMLVLTNP